MSCESKSPESKRARVPGVYVCDAMVDNLLII